jgi:hypothetical protein
MKESTVASEGRVIAALEAGLSATFGAAGLAVAEV